MKALRVAAALLAVSAVTAASAGARPAAKEQNIVATAQAAGSFTTLTKLLRVAGLTGALSGKGPFTVFAPTDAAFAKVPKATLTALVANKAKLKAVLLYHVVSGRVTASQATMLTSAKTLEGKRIRVTHSGGGVYVNGAKVTQADVKASNGVIHVVNRVLIP